jgi:uncharacterized DUF497 family protein
MTFVTIVWDLEDDPGGNVQQIAQHGVSREEVEDVLLDDDNPTAKSRTSGRPITFGYTSDGRYLGVVWELLNDDPRMIYPVTAYDAPEPR